MAGLYYRIKTTYAFLCVILLEGLSAVKPLGLQQGWLENQCCTLPEYCRAFKSHSAQRNGEFKRIEGKQQESPHDPSVSWELPTDIHAD